MPTPKKLWVFDGHVAQYGSSLISGSVHAANDCVDCHGGVDGTADRAAAHAGMQRMPGAGQCGQCHETVAALAARSLHTAVGGMPPVLQERGVNMAEGSVARARFEKQCAKCHLANTAGQTACGNCHVSVPPSAGGGFLAGHRFFRTPSTDNNCTACHGSRVKDEYYGQNGALLARNATTYPASSPWRTYALRPDVHRTAGMGCDACHSPGEMHGVGAVPGVDRYGISGTPRCLDCHGPGKADAQAFQGVGSMHNATHLGKLDCQVCHAQPYKNCFGCHTDVTAEGAGFYRINETDPTRVARTAAGATLVAGDALMAFRVGRNPKAAQPGQKEYSVLRHVPVDPDVFRYDGTNAVDDLVPSMSSSPTWKHATPHSISRRTPIQVCGNCHGPDYAMFWLTDPVGAASGWIPDPAAYPFYQFEIDANLGLLQAAPPPIVR